VARLIQSAVATEIAPGQLGPHVVAGEAEHGGPSEPGGWRQPRVLWRWNLMGDS
jgi:hypothetical protein